MDNFKIGFMETFEFISQAFTWNNMGNVAGWMLIIGGAAIAVVILGIIFE